MTRHTLSKKFLNILQTKEMAFRDLDPVRHFMEITGSSEAEARRFIEISGDVPIEIVINQFLDLMGGGGLVSNLDRPSRGADAVDRLRNFEVEGALQEQALERHIRGTVDQSIQNSIQPKSVVSPKPNTRFEDLFRPPIDLIFEGGLTEAREYGTAESRWVIVELQDRSVFNSLITSRDLWPNTAINDLIREMFVFQQYNVGSSNGNSFCTLYGIDRDQVPYIALIDPRTGENLHFFGGDSQPIDPLKFAAYLRAFLDVNGSVNGYEPPKLVSERLFQQFYEMEEQMQAAIRASLETQQQTLRHQEGPNRRDLHPGEKELSASLFVKKIYVH